MSESVAILYSLERTGQLDVAARQFKTFDQQCATNAAYARTPEVIQSIDSALAAAADDSTKLREVGRRIYYGWLPRLNIAATIVYDACSGMQLAAPRCKLQNGPCRARDKRIVDRIQ